MEREQVVVGDVEVSVASSVVFVSVVDFCFVG